MGEVFTFASGKGGVGKTTLTANIGIALAERGKRVLLVDADIAMANLSLLLGMHSSPITLHDVLLGESTIHDAIYDGPGGVSFVPSGLSYESYRRVDSERLESVINSVKNQFDFILLDAPAGIEKNVLAALKAADKILLITMPISPSVADVLKTKIVAQRIGVPTIGVIVNFVRNEKGEIPSDDISKMLELPIFGLVPYDEEIRKSFMQERIQPTILSKPKAQGVQSMREIAARMSGEKVELKIKEKREGFLSKLLSIFRRKKPLREEIPKKEKREELSIPRKGKKETEFREEVPEISGEYIEIKK